MPSFDEYEPLDYYTNFLRTEYRRNCESYFDSLVKSSGVNPAENAHIVSRYNAALSKAEETLNGVKAGKALRVFVILQIVVLCLCSAWFFLLAFNLGWDDFGYNFNFFTSTGTYIFLIILNCTAIKSLIKESKEKYEEEMAVVKSIKEEGRKQLSPLHSLFHWNMTREILEKTAPFIKLDENFDIKKLDLLCRKYSYKIDNDPTSSTVFLLSGSIDENPFLFRRYYYYEIEMQTYTGSIQIEWTTKYKDSEGRTQYEHHSQVLTASVTKPAPFFYYKTVLVYGNEAADKLWFIRKPSFLMAPDEDEVKKIVKKKGKKISKKMKKAVTSGKSNFTAMANTEFEALFGVQDRTDEVEFRLMFTPLAQENMVDLITSDAGYGDDFHFYKNGPLNFIVSSHAQKWNYDSSPEQFMGFNLKKIRRDFINFNTEYFRSLYFDLAPLLSIPLYRRHKPKEFIYKDVYNSNTTMYEAEVLANLFDKYQFSPDFARTDSILKAEFLKKEGKTDKVRIHASSFDAEEHVEYIPVYGGDGKIHRVPVPWIEYIPVKGKSDMAIKYVGGTHENYDEVRKTSAFEKFIQRVSADGNSQFFDGFIAFPLKRGGMSISADKELNALFNNK